MHFRMGTIDGGIFISDGVDTARMDREILDANGFIGTGDYENVRVENHEDALAFIDSVVNRAVGDPEGTVTLEINGVTHKWSGDEVAWIRRVE